MATPKAQEKKKFALPIPLLVTAGLIIIVGLGILFTDKVQRQDPTMTAAPVTGTPGQIYTASPAKQAKQQELMARNKAVLDSMKAALH